MEETTYFWTEMGKKNRIFWTNFVTLTLSLPITTIVPYAKSLDPDETQSHPDPSYLTLRQHFHRL